MVEYVNATMRKELFDALLKAHRDNFGEVSGKVMFVGYKTIVSKGRGNKYYVSFYTESNEIGHDVMFKGKVK